MEYGNLPGSFDFNKIFAAGSEVTEKPKINDEELLGWARKETNYNEEKDSLVNTLDSIRSQDRTSDSQEPEKSKFENIRENLLVGREINEIISADYGIEATLHGELQKRVAAIKESIIQEQKKKIEKKGVMKLVMAAIYKSRIIRKPEIENNPDVEIKEICLSIMKDYAERGKQKVEEFRNVVDSCIKHYEDLTETQIKQKEAIRDCITHYESLADRIEVAYANRAKLNHILKELRQEKIRAWTDPEIEQSISGYTRECNENDRNITGLERCKENILQNMRMLRRGYLYTQNNIQIYQGLVQLGRENLNRVEINLAELDEMIWCKKTENQTLTIIDSENREGEESADYKPFFRTHKNIFKSIENVGAEFKNWDRICDFNPEDHNYSGSKECSTDLEVYEELKDIIYSFKRE